MMKFGHIEIFARDPMASMAFYRDVLLCEVEEIQHGRFVWLNLGGQGILLRPGIPHSTEMYQQANVAFVLYTDDVGATKAALQERGVLFRGTDGSDRCPTFCDPDGTWFQLVNPVDH